MQKLIVEVAGTGKKTDQQRNSAFRHNLHRLNAASATISINGTNYVTGGNIISCEFDSATTSALIRHSTQAPGSSPGQIRGRMEHGDREIFLRFVARRLRTSEDAFTKIANQTTGTAAITLQGALITGSTYHDMSATTRSFSALRLSRRITALRPCRSSAACKSTPEWNRHVVRHQRVAARRHWKPSSKQEQPPQMFTTPEQINVQILRRRNATHGYRPHAE